MSRGSGRRRIAIDDLDREHRLDWLRRTAEAYGWRLHAFVLLDNHEHLLVETPRANLSASMQFLNGGYTAWFNRRRRRAGALFRGRYKAQLVEGQGHYLELSRYMHLNPCRRGRVERPQQWRWSSYPGYVDQRRQLPWITYESVLGELGRISGGEAGRRRAYRQFVNAGLKGALESPFAAAVHGHVIGSEQFVNKARPWLRPGASPRSLPQATWRRGRPRLQAIVSATAAVFGVRPAALTGRPRVDDGSRAVAVYVARVRCGYPSRDVADALGYRSHGGATTALRRYEADKQLLAPSARRVEKLLAGDG